MTTKDKGFSFFADPQKIIMSPNKHCTHWQVAQPTHKPKLVKDCNLLPIDINENGLQRHIKKNIST